MHITVRKRNQRNGSNEVSSETFTSHPLPDGFFLSAFCGGAPAYSKPAKACAAMPGLRSRRQRVWPSGQSREKHGAQSSGGW